VAVGQRVDWGKVQATEKALTESYREYLGLQGGEGAEFEKPEVKTVAPGVDSWMTQPTVANLLAQATVPNPPAWATPPVVSALTEANKYMTTTGGAMLPPALQSTLGNLMMQPPAEAAPAPAPAVPEFDYGLYGLTPEQWATLDPWKQKAMRLMGTGTAAGATTGALAGAQGGLGGAIGGAALGAGLGSLFSGKLADKYPALQSFGKWLGDAFDVLVENMVMKPAGMVQLGTKAAVEESS